LKVDKVKVKVSSKPFLRVGIRVPLKPLLKGKGKGWKK
jgi:hypothetical protein